MDLDQELERISRLTQLGRALTLAGRDVRAVGATNVALRGAMATALEQQAAGKLMTKCARLREQVQALKHEGTFAKNISDVLWRRETAEDAPPLGMEK